MAPKTATVSVKQSASSDKLARTGRWTDYHLIFHLGGRDLVQFNGSMLTFLKIMR